MDFDNLLNQFWGNFGVPKWGGLGDLFFKVFRVGSIWHKRGDLELTLGPSWPNLNDHFGLSLAGLYGLTRNTKGGPISGIRLAATLTFV